MSVELEIISDTPDTGEVKTPVLFVHGMWHGAWCWEKFLPYFSQKGYPAYALSLRGHCGSSSDKQLRWTRIKDYVKDVAAAVDSIPSPPVVIGHSMGGFIVQRYLENHSAPAGVLLAACPPQGLLPTLLRYSLQHPLVTLRSVLTTNLYPLVGTPELARSTLISPEFPDEEFLNYHKLLQNEAFLAFLDMVALSLPKPDQVKAPMLVLGGEKDTVISQNQVRSTAKAYKTEAEFFPTAHDMMLDIGWESVADRITDWLESQNL